MKCTLVSLMRIVAQKEEDNMGFPAKEELQTMLENVEKKDGTLALSSNPTPLEQFRFDLCQMFIQYKQEQGITQREMARRLGVDEAKVSKILHHRIQRFSTDRLITLLLQLNPNLSLKAS